MTDKMYDEGEVPIIHIPARPNKDYDLLVGEMLIRFSEIIEEKEKRSMIF